MNSDAFNLETLYPNYRSCLAATYAAISMPPGTPYQSNLIGFGCHQTLIDALTGDPDTELFNHCLHEHNPIQKQIKSKSDLAATLCKQIDSIQKNVGISVTISALSFHETEPKDQLSSIEACAEVSDVLLVSDVFLMEDKELQRRFNHTIRHHRNKIMKPSEQEQHISNINSRGESIVTLQKMRDMMHVAGFPRVDIAWTDFSLAVIRGSKQIY